ncbi:hypothetical protein [Micromonospora sp. WMMD987]|uniref:hypothetical protein n=1 Tax=Micromonospora sp. WMMD987 TaxID=3016089 RepID=UPI00249CCC92|nr:hypothetical protein [Micromonospora sp. WMMD987]WFE93565.1 hypothetical protein O7612_19340 [Micromonospora sp. WMMD987]
MSIQVVRFGPSKVDTGGMSPRRLALLITCLAVAGLAATFAIVGWDETGRMASAVSALAAVAAVGVAVWAALDARRDDSAIEVSGTGDAEARDGGRANTGLSGDPGTRRPIKIRKTGTAKATGEGGDANTGAQR